MTSFRGDAYAVLGVSLTASPAEIKRAYRRLALAWHPDRNPGDPRAGERFARMHAAFELLSDAAARARYDRARAVRTRPDAAPIDGPTWAESARASDAGAPSEPVERAPAHAPTVECDVTIGVLEAVRGAEVRLAIDGTPLRIRIPAGARDGARARVRSVSIAQGRGATGTVDLVLRIHVRAAG